MSAQHELNQADNAAERSSETPFDRARARHGLGPDVKLALLFDRRPAHEHARCHAMLAFDRSSPWYDFLPDEQIVDVLTREQMNEREAHELAVFAHWLKYDDPHGRRKK